MISHNEVRFTQSAQCFQALQLPPGTRAEHFASGLDLAKAREVIAADLFGEWLFFVDDDTLFAPDLLLRLLERLEAYPELDVVAAFVLRRWPPHFTTAGRLEANGTVSMLDFPSGHGLARVDLTGLGGGAVIRASAFARVPQPWFTGGALTEDWTFCTRLKAVGGQVAVDVDLPVGHITPMAVWPTRHENGEWGVSYMPIRDGRQAMTVERVGIIAGEGVPA